MLLGHCIAGIQFENQQETLNSNVEAPIKKEEPMVLSTTSIAATGTQSIKWQIWRYNRITKLHRGWEVSEGELVEKVCSAAVSVGQY